MVKKEKEARDYIQKFINEFPPIKLLFNQINQDTDLDKFNETVDFNDGLSI